MDVSFIVVNKCKSNDKMGGPALLSLNVWVKLPRVIYNLQPFFMDGLIGKAELLWRIPYIPFTDDYAGYKHRMVYYRTTGSAT